jgi:hypothetical protein
MQDSEASCIDRSCPEAAVHALNDASGKIRRDTGK